MVGVLFRAFITKISVVNSTPARRRDDENNIKNYTFSCFTGTVNFNSFSNIIVRYWNNDIIFSNVILRNRMVASFIYHDTVTGIQALVIAFLVSPYGLPRIGAFCIALIEAVNCKIRAI